MQLSYVGVPLVYATLLLYISLFTLTLTPLCGFFIRLILLPPTIYYFWQACSLYHLFDSCFAAAGVATVGCYGCLLALQFTLLRPWAPTKPQWIVITRKEDGRIRTVHHDPEDFPERLLYVLDLMFSFRGTSWISNREWDWNHPKHRIAMAPPISRRDFLRNCFKKIVLLFLLLDVFDTIIKSKTWDLKKAADPFYMIPVWQQCIFAIALGVNTSVTLNIQYNVISSFAVWLGNDPVNWPALFDSPFCATSISDFWSNRWHWIFRRTFVQLSIPIVQFSKRLCGGERSLSIILGRTFGAFGVSAMVHLFIMYHAERWAVLKLRGGSIDQVTFWDGDVLSFFMAQPLGVVFERYVLEAAVDQFFPSSLSSANDVVDKEKPSESSERSSRRHPQPDKKPPPRWEKVIIMRAFAWIFLTWTGRWWTNKWIRSGLFAADAKTVPLSPIRSLWYRKMAP